MRKRSLVLSIEYLHESGSLAIKGNEEYCFVHWLTGTCVNMYRNSKAFPKFIQAMAASNALVSVRFSSVAQLCLTLCDPMDCSMPDFPVHHQLPELVQIHINWVGDAIQPSRPLSSPSPLAFHLSQHQGLFQWVGSSHQVAKVLEVWLQHQSFQWVFRIDFP